MGRPSRPRRPPPTAEELSKRIIGPQWAQTDDFVVRSSVTESKRYRCPWCEGWIEPGTIHVVAYKRDDPEGRRHYHNPCWRKAGVGGV